MPRRHDVEGRRTQRHSAMMLFIHPSFVADTIDARGRLPPDVIAGTLRLSADASFSPIRLPHAIRQMFGATDVPAARHLHVSADVASLLNMPFIATSDTGNRLPHAAAATITSPVPRCCRSVGHA